MDKFRSNPYFLHPSTLFVSSDQNWVTTILGSCISVCFFDQKKKVGGINHYMLPLWNGEGLESPKYGNIAILQLFRKMLDNGAKKEDIVCKIFGGAEVLGEHNSVYNVGQRNIDLAFKVMEELGIPIVGSSTGGKVGRRIHFNTHTGEVFQKYLVKPSQNSGNEAKD